MKKTPPFITNCQTLLLGTSVTQCVGCHFQLNEYRDELFEQFNIYFPNQLSRAITQRKAEFLAGRYVAQQALQGLPQQTADISIGKHRSPNWPDGIKGSISHSGTQAFCAISNIGYDIGIDFEQRMSSTMAKQIQNSLITTQEMQWQSHGNLSFADWLSVIFSTKESLFKALYPRVRTYFDFLDVTARIHTQNQLAELRLKKNINTELRNGQVFTVHYRWLNNGVFSFISL